MDMMNISKKSRTDLLIVGFRLNFTRTCPKCYLSDLSHEIAIASTSVREASTASHLKDYELVTLKMCDQWQVMINFSPKGRTISANPFMIAIGNTVPFRESGG